MKPACQHCQDSGRSPSSDSLDCTKCCVAEERMGLDEFCSDLPPGQDPSDFRWAIYKLGVETMEKSVAAYFAERNSARDLVRRYKKELEQISAQIPHWISVADRLPEVGTWCNVLVDRNEGDYFTRLNKPRFEVFSAQMWDIDNEGYAYWRRWVMADGGPMGPLYHVTHWMPLPPPPEGEKE